MAYFDICGYVCTDLVREITISINGNLLKIRETRVGNSDVWIVPGENLATILKGRYKSAYPMFFGVLLTALSAHGTKAPINGICLDDVDRSLEGREGDFHQLIEIIASGGYESGKRA